MYMLLASRPRHSQHEAEALDEVMNAQNPQAIGEPSGGGSAAAGDL
jgi:hypothetical protein